MMFFESIESRLSSVVRIESFGKCFIIPSAREARFVPCVELFKACKKCFFVSVSCCPKTELFWFLGEDRQKHKFRVRCNTH
jgi:hypothetical protein